MLENVCFQWCNYNADKIDCVAYFYEQICQFLFICFQVHGSKMSANYDKFLLNYGVHFLSGHSVYKRSQRVPVQCPVHPRGLENKSHFFILRVVDPAAARIMHQNMPFSDGKKLKNSSGKLNPS